MVFQQHIKSSNFNNQTKVWAEFNPLFLTVDKSFPPPPLIWIIFSLITDVYVRQRRKTKDIEYLQPLLRSLTITENKTKKKKVTLMEWEIINVGPHPAINLTSYCDTVKAGEMQSAPMIMGKCARHIRRTGRSFQTCDGHSNYTSALRNSIEITWNFHGYM